MANATCPNCGATTEYGTKFCRRCGQPLDASEATTRTLEEPERIEASTRYTNSAPTSPTYNPPASLSAPAPSTSGLESQRQKKTVTILAAAVAVLLVAVAVLVVILMNNRPGKPAGGRTTVIQPPMPPAAPGAPTAVSDDLFYPGADVVMRMGDGEGGLVQLRTSDPIGKVSQWYREKITPVNTISKEGKIVLTGSGIMVVMQEGGDGTSIMLARGQNE